MFGELYVSANIIYEYNINITHFRFKKKSTNKQINKYKINYFELY